MHPLHLTALHLLGLAAFILLLVQTARASFWKGKSEGWEGKNDNLCEEIEHTRDQRDRAIKDALQMREYLQRLHERAVLAHEAPELFAELMQANDLLRSVSAIVERDGADTNWSGLEDRVSERLKAQHALLYAAPVAS